MQSVGEQSPLRGEQSSAAEESGRPVPKEWTGSSRPFPRDRSVLDFIRSHVQSHPENVAIKEGPRRMTYRELDRCSNQVANELRRRGLRLEEPVVVFLPASCEFLAAIVGVLKAGGTYFPVDPDTPRKRLEFLLGDSGSRLVLSNETGLAGTLEWPGTVMDVSQILSAIGIQNSEDTGAPSDPNRRAYITYTSGSTGQPKGVEIEHGALTSLVCHYHRRLNLTARDQASMLAYVAFDASVADIWPALCAGGTVTIPPKGILLNPDGLIAWLAAEEITLAFVPTGLVEILFARPWPEGMKLRFLITGGDRLRVRPPAGLPFVVINGYGPTENTVFSTWSVVKPENGTGQAPPIGKPIENTTAYVLDERLQPVPVQVAGELYLGGEQVARGYLGRNDLTAERFLPDPFTDRPGSRMYRTGDWVRWLADGELDFLGRKDGQVQIRGRRVELGEIEAALQTHGAVRQVCCVPWLDDGMPASLIAHLVPKTHSPGLADELRAHLRDRLPDYMVPSEFVLHESLPLTPQGKLDRAALMALQATKSATPQIVRGEDGLKQALATLWHSLLPAAGNAPQDATFAALGGDSLLAIKLMLGVEEITGLRLEISTFLIKPTLAGLCEAASERVARTEFQPVLALRRHGTRPPLFCVHGHSGDIEDYFSLTEALGDDQPVFGLRSHALDDLSRAPQSMEAAATEIVHWIRKLQPKGNVSLVGYSWAGLLAFEVARQLAETDGILCFTALIDAMAPMRPTRFTSRLAHFAKYSPPWIWNVINDPKDRSRRLRRWREMIGQTQRHLAKAQVPMEEWAISPSPLSQRLIRLIETYHPPRGSEVEINLFRESESSVTRVHPLRAWQTHHLPDGGWNYWVRRQTRVHWLPGDHWTMVKPPAVSRLAEAIRTAMDRHWQLNAPTTRPPIGA